MSNCPNSDQLEQFFRGNLDSTVFETVANHVETCAGCQSLVSQYANQEPAWNVPATERPLRKSGGPMPSGMLQRMAKRLASNGQSDPIHLKTGVIIDTDHPNPDSFIIPKQFGDYRIIREIDRGGMGTVFLAEHVRLKRLVAAKLMNKPKNRQLQARFFREMEVAGQLDHPNIVRTTDAGERDGVCFIAMELLDGVDVGRLAMNRPLSVADACEIARQAALGLDYAHQRGLIHRDVKPANLMVTREGVVKILDLGLARTQDQLQPNNITRIGEVPGTVDFMAPEQCSDDEQTGPASDVYALGATLFRLLAGQPPLAKYKTLISKLSALSNNVVPPLSSARTGLPAGLPELVDEMLQLDPAMRPTDAMMVANRLKPFCTAASLAQLVETSTAVPANELSTISQMMQRTKDDHASPKGKPAREFPNRVFRYLAWFSAAFFAILFSVVIYLKIGESVLRIETNSPDLSVRIDGQEAEISGNGEPIRIRPGDHILNVRQGDFEFQTDNFRLTRGEAEILKVELLDGSIEVVRDGDVIERHVVPSKAETPIVKPEPTKVSYPIDDDQAKYVANLSNAIDQEFVAWLNEWTKTSSVDVKLSIELRETVLREFGSGQLGNFSFRLRPVYMSGYFQVDGPDMFVTSVFIYDRSFGEKQELLDRISRLPCLRVLNIETTSPTDLIMHLGEIPGIWTLNMYKSGGGFTDESISALKKFPALRELLLGRTEVTDEGLAHLALLAGDSLPHLNSLTTNIGHSNKGMESISKIRTLRHVQLGTSDRIDAAGIAHLKALPLETLIMYRCPIGDDCIDDLLEIPSLEHVGVVGTEITARGLLRLKALPNLRIIDAREQSITKAELKELREQMPGVEIGATPR